MLPKQLKQNAGVTLISAMTAVAVIGVVSVVVATMLQNAVSATKTNEFQEDLDALRETIRNRLDCRNTLQAESAALPLSCAAYSAATYSTSWSLRRRGVPNSSALDIAPGGQLGKWKIKAACQGNHLIIGASRPELPATGQAWPADLFGGLSDFCREFFDPDAACAGVYNIAHGSDDRGRICCRQVTALGSPPKFVATAACGSGEYLAGGGGSCDSAYTGAVPSSAVQPPNMHTSLPFFAGGKWVVDCLADSDAVTPPETENQAYALALCCPRQ